MNSRLLLILLVCCLSTHAQRLSKTLQTRTWYCSGDLNSDSLILSEENNRQFDWEARFSPDGKASFRNLRTNATVSHYQYALKKNTLRLYYDRKDSIQNLNYIVNFAENGNYRLNAFYAMRYKKQGPGDLPPATRFSLRNGKKSRDFHQMEEITVYHTKKGLRNDSVDYVSKGDFLQLHKDTLLLSAYQFSEHHFYRKYTDTLHFISETFYDSLILIRIPVKEIVRIHSVRECFNKTMNALSIGALGTFVVSFPMALAIQKDPANTIFTSAAVYSALSIPFIVSANMIFSRERFELAPSGKKRTLWHFGEDSPAGSR
jgi:hypothetical protein